MFDYCNNRNVIFNSVKTLNYSTTNVIGLSEKYAWYPYCICPNTEQKFLFKIPTSKYAKKLSISLQDAPAIIPYVRYLNLKISSHEKKILEWLYNLPVLEKLEIDCDYYDENFSLDLRKLSKTLRSFSIFCTGNIEKIIFEHPNLEMLNISSDNDFDINFDKLPKLIHFDSPRSPRKIICSQERFFKNFHVSKNFEPYEGDENIPDDRPNIVVYNGKSYESPYRYFDTNDFIFLENNLTLGDKFYKKHYPVFDTLIIHSGIHRIERSIWHDRIKKIDLHKNVTKKFLSNFKNLEEISIGLGYSCYYCLRYPGKMLKAIFYLMTKKNKNLKLRLSSDRIYSHLVFKKFFLKFPEDRFYINYDHFFVDKTLINDFILFAEKFLKKNNSIRIKTVGILPKSWLDEFNYIYADGIYFLTRKPHCGVVIGNCCEYISFYKCNTLYENIVLEIVMSRVYLSEKIKKVYAENSYLNFPYECTIGDFVCNKSVIYSWPKSFERLYMDKKCYFMGTIENILFLDENTKSVVLNLDPDGFFDEYDRENYPTTNLIIDTKNYKVKLEKFFVSGIEVEFRGEYPIESEDFTIIPLSFRFRE